MFGLRLSTIVKRDFEKRRRARKMPQMDIVAEQVKKVLETEDQKLILMVRG